MRPRLLLSVLGCLCVVLLTALTGNADAVDPAAIQDIATMPAAIGTGTRLTQTIIPGRDRLHALQVRWQIPGDFVPAPGGRVVLHLRDKADGDDIATAWLALGELRNNEFSKFIFATIPDSDGRTFFVSFDIPPGSIERGMPALWASGQDDYANGELMVNGSKMGGDLVMRAYYEPDLPMLLAALARLVGQYWRGLAAAFLVSCAIGLAMAGSAVSVSLAASAFAGLAALAGVGVLLLFLRLDPTLLLLLVLLVAALGAVRLARKPRVSGSQKLGTGWEWAALSVVALVVGLLQIRDTEVPLWVDSVTHARLIQSLLSEGQLPASSFYHLGFHTITALVARLSGIDIPGAILLMGPFLITLCALSVARLAHRLSPSPVAPLTAAVCIWFLSPMPSYLITWGRYPLLLGAVLLPAALVALLDWIESEKANWRDAVVATVLLGGLAFAHVRLAVFYLAFLAVYLGIQMAKRSPEARARLPRLLLPVLTAAIFGALWVGAVIWRGLSLSMLLSENTVAPMIDIGTAAAVMLTHHGPIVIGLAAAAAIIGLFNRSRTTLVVLIWYALLALIALVPRLDALGSLISPDLVVLMAFVPIALVIGDASAWLWSRFSTQDQKIHNIIWASAAVLIILIGARDMISVVNPATVTYSDADARAQDWLRAETPNGSPILINSFNWYGSAYVPSDGGAWIPFVTGRPTVFLDSHDLALSSQPDALADWMRARGVEYAYVGWKGGILTRADLDCSTRFIRVYYEDGVAIFRLASDLNPPLLSPPPSNCSLRG